MKTMTVEMPPIAQCGVTQCAYNQDRNCRAKAITVGDSSHPGCDTFFASRRHTQERNRTAGVGACKVSVCRFNVDLECNADRITVNQVGNDVRCTTFAPRAGAAP